MISMARDLKSENRKFEIAFLLANLVVWFFFAYPEQIFSLSVESLFPDAATTSFTALVVTILVMILDGVVPARLKEVIAFWKVTNAAPAHRAFSRFAIEDHRVDVEALENAIGPFPDVPSEQHSLWIRLLNKKRDDPAVLASEKPYLLMRNLSVLALAILIAYPLMFIMTVADWWLFFGYSSLLTIQFVVVSLSAQGYGNRFVGTVLHKAIV